MGEVVGVVGVEDGPRYTIKPALPFPPSDAFTFIDILSFVGLNGIHSFSL